MGERERQVVDLAAVEREDERRTAQERAQRHWTGPSSSLTRRLGLLSTALVAGDALTLGAAFVVASRLRFGPEWTDRWDLLLPEWRLLVPLYVAVVCLGLAWSGRTPVHGAWSPRQELRTVGRAAVVVSLSTLGLLYVVKLPDVSRLFSAAFLVLAAGGLVASRMAVRAWFRRQGADARRLRHVVVVGGGPAARRFVERVTAHPDVGLRVLGHLSDVPGEVGDRPYLGRPEDIASVLALEVVDEVAICLPLWEWQRIEGIVAIAQEQGKVVHVPVDALGGAATRGRLEQLDGLPVLTLSSTPHLDPLHTAKRVLDVAVAAVGLVLTSPLLLAIAVTVLVRDGRPVFFAQPRVGLHGREFSMRKFRTMVVDAEAQRADLMALNEREGPAFKVRDDPRVTRTGRFLRATSLDELPQLVNVLLGEMSLVGPRPPLVHEAAGYDAWHRRRLSMRPGMTGLWQVSARDQPGFDSWVEVDLRYIDEWSFWRDARILAQTIPAMLRATGT